MEIVNSVQVRRLAQQQASSGRRVTYGNTKRRTISSRLFSQVKAILKTWAPGVVEACNRADFYAAMGGLSGGERVSFQRVCEIAAAVLESTGGVSEDRFPPSAPAQHGAFLSWFGE